MDKHIPTNNKITGDKPSQQLLPKQVATQPSLLNQTNRINLPLLNCRPRPTSETFLISCRHRRLNVVWIRNHSNSIWTHRLNKKVQNNKSTDYLSSLLKQLIYTNFPRDSESKFSSVLVASISHTCSLYSIIKTMKQKSAHPKSLFCLLPHICPNP